MGRALVAQKEQGAKQAEAAEMTQAQKAEFQALVDDEKATTEAIPDYPMALSYLFQSRTAELVELGVDEDRAKEITNQEISQGIADARKQGISPSRLAYKLAKDRGYTKAEPKPGGDPQPKAAGGEALKALEAGAAAAKTLSANGGRGADPGSSIESRVANLSGQALIDAWNKHKNSI
jgi:hypothetical protein